MSAAAPSPSASAGRVCRHCGSVFAIPIGAPSAAPDGAATTSGSGPADAKAAVTKPDPADARRDFCSPACAAIHARIVRDGLDRYYTLRDRAVAPAGESVFQARDYTWLEEEMRAAETVGRRTAELILDIQGLACVGCVWLIERLFQRRAGALALDVNATQGRLYWRWEAGRFDAVACARELQTFGYLVGPRGEKPDAAATRALRLRLGLCAAFALNTMLFVLPAYLGLAPGTEFARVFALLAGLFATAALLTGGTYFARRAWAGIRAGVMNLDVPITLGLILGYAGSLFGWATARPHLVYFDFVAVFSFLMLVGRWLQETAVERNRQQLLGLVREPTAVKVYPGAPADQGGPNSTAPSDRPEGSDKAPIRRPVTALRQGDVFAVGGGQVVPVAARLVAAAAVFTTEWINGEPEPREVPAGQVVPAGAACVSLGEVRLEALEAWATSSLAPLLAVDGVRAFRSAATENVIRIYLGAIIGLALLGGAGWWWGGGDSWRAFQVTIAVLVASCPCAIGVTFPLVEEMASAAMRRRGVFVRELSLFPRLRRVRQVLFDKTGTLTLETPVLRNSDTLDVLSDRARRRLWQLVRANPHPVARALQEALVFVADDAADDGGIVEETVGQGVYLRRTDGIWTLGRPGFGAANEATPPREVEAASGVSDLVPGVASGPTAGGDPDGVTRRAEPANPTPPTAVDAEFAHDGRVLARFVFTEAIRTDARTELAELQRAGFRVFILSGDRPSKVAAVAAALGVPPAHAMGGMSPDLKRRWVEAHDADDTLLLGDGANDSLAFDAAFARGTPVIHRGLLEQKSDFYYLGHGLRGVRQLFVVAAIRRRTLRRVFAFAVLYNVAILGAALAGYVNPLVAAVVMPASSLAGMALGVGGMRAAFRPEKTQSRRSGLAPR